MKLNLRLSNDTELKIDTKKVSDSRYDLCENDYVKGHIDIEEKNGSYIMSIEAVSSVAFAAEDSLSIIFDWNSEREMLAIHRWNTCWIQPVFSADEPRKNIQKILLKEDGKFLFLMPILRDNLTEMSIAPDFLTIDISTLSRTADKISEVVMIATKSEDCRKAIREGYKLAYEEKLIDTPLKDGKKYPEELEGLGWCTWNAFYHDVTEAGIENKLKEFNEKDIKLSWLIIDDGWSPREEEFITSFKEDYEKFPSGLKASISRMKEEYGVKYVGIWHSFNAYWSGVKEGSELYNEQKENLIKNKEGFIVPAPEYDKAFAFFDAWHTYLKEQGVDFVKIDTQGNGLKFYDDIAAIREVHRAVEASVVKNFGGAIINCMGLGNYDMYSREHTLVVRNSNDFYPKKEGGFTTHIEQNVYHAVFNDDLCCCDFDMWWTNHVEEKQSLVLRMLSGGPVYISDEVGNTSSEYLNKVIDENGNMVRLENAPRPTADCLFGYDKVLKIYNKLGDSYIVGIFNLSDKEQKVSFKLSDICETEELSAELYFAKEKHIISDNTINLSLTSQDVEVIMLNKK